MLYNIEADPSEQYDVAKTYPNVVEELKKIFETHIRIRSVVKAEPELDKVVEKQTAPGGGGNNK